MLQFGKLLTDSHMKMILPTAVGCWWSTGPVWRNVIYVLDPTYNVFPVVTRDSSEHKPNGFLEMSFKFLSECRYVIVGATPLMVITKVFTMELVCWIVFVVVISMAYQNGSKCNLCCYLFFTIGIAYLFLYILEHLASYGEQPLIFGSPPLPWPKPNKVEQRSERQFSVKIPFLTVVIISIISFRVLMEKRPNWLIRFWFSYLVISFWFIHVAWLPHTGIESISLEGCDCLGWHGTGHFVDAIHRLLDYFSYISFYFTNCSAFH